MSWCIQLKTFGIRSLLGASCLQYTLDPDGLTFSAAKLRSWTLMHRALRVLWIWLPPATSLCRQDNTGTNFFRCQAPALG